MNTYIEKLIDEIENTLQLKLCSEYKTILREHDGAFTNLIQLYSADQIIERNKTYEVQLYAPEYYLIGSKDSFPILMKSGINTSVFENDWGALTPDCMTEIASNVATLINKED